LDLKELKEILQILEEKEITEFELEEEGMKLRIRKAAPPSANHASAPPSSRARRDRAAGHGRGAVPTPPTGTLMAEATGPVPADEEPGLAVVRARSSARSTARPTQLPAFVDVGDT